MHMFPMEQGKCQYRRRFRFLYFAPQAVSNAEMVFFTESAYKALGVDA